MIHKITFESHAPSSFDFDIRFVRWLMWLREYTLLCEMVTVTARVYVTVRCLTARLTWIKYDHVRFIKRQPPALSALARDQTKRISSVSADVVREQLRFISYSCRCSYLCGFIIVAVRNEGMKEWTCSEKILFFQDSSQSFWFHFASIIQLLRRRKAVHSLAVPMKYHCVISDCSDAALILDVYSWCHVNFTADVFAVSLVSLGIDWHTARSWRRWKIP
jgi:hypothetical protein